VCERARTALGEFDVECITHITVEILANIGDAARRPQRRGRSTELRVIIDPGRALRCDALANGVKVIESGAYDCTSPGYRPSIITRGALRLAYRPEQPASVAANLTSA
jgi:hypothetical protein